VSRVETFVLISMTAQYGADICALPDGVTFGYEHRNDL